MEIRYQRPRRHHGPTDNLRLEGERQAYSSRYEREFGVVGFRKRDSNPDPARAAQQKPESAPPTSVPAFPQTSGRSSLNNFVPSATPPPDNDDAEGSLVSDDLLLTVASAVADDDDYGGDDDSSSSGLFAFEAPTPAHDEGLQDEYDDFVEENVAAGTPDEPAAEEDFIELGSNPTTTNDARPSTEFTVTPISTAHSSNPSWSGVLPGAQHQPPSPFNLVARKLIVPDDNCGYGSNEPGPRPRYPRRPKKAVPKSNLALPPPDADALADWRRPINDNHPNFWDGAGGGSDGEYRFDDREEAEEEEDPGLTRVAKDPQTESQVVEEEVREAFEKDPEDTPNKVEEILARGRKSWKQAIADVNETKAVGVEANSQNSADAETAPPGEVIINESNQPEVQEQMKKSHWAKALNKTAHEPVADTLEEKLDPRKEEDISTDGNEMQGSEEEIAEDAVIEDETNAEEPQEIEIEEVLDQEVEEVANEDTSEPINEVVEDESAENLPEPEPQEVIEEILEEDPLKSFEDGQNDEIQDVTATDEAQGDNEEFLEPTTSDVLEEEIPEGTDGDPAGDQVVDKIGADENESMSAETDEVPTEEPIEEDPEILEDPMRPEDLAKLDSIVGAWQLMCKH